MEYVVELKDRDEHITVEADTLIRGKDSPLLWFENVTTVDGVEKVEIVAVFPSSALSPSRKQTSRSRAAGGA